MCSMAATARHRAMGRFALLESTRLSGELASNLSYDPALTVDPPSVQPGDSRTLDYAPSGALVKRAFTTQSTPRHSRSFTKFPRSRLPARVNYLATGLGQYGQFAALRALLFL